MVMQKTFSQSQKVTIAFNNLNIVQKYKDYFLENQGNFFIVSLCEIKERVMCFQCAIGAE